MIRLRYIGDGLGQWVPGVPAAAHDCEDEALAAELVQSGLYERAEGEADPAAAARPGEPAAANHQPARVRTDIAAAGEED